MTPLKEYPSFEAFQYELGLNLRDPGCRQLIASLVPQGSAGAFMARLNQHLYQTRPDPAGQVPPVYVDEVDLKLALVGIDTPAHELFTTLNHQHLDRSRPMPACWRCPRPMPTASCCRNAWSTT